jgi:hypothetical protein
VDLVPDPLLLRKICFFNINVDYSTPHINSKRDRSHNGERETISMVETLSLIVRLTKARLIGWRNLSFLCDLTAASKRWTYFSV